MLHIAYVLCFVLVFPTVVRGIQEFYVKEGANIRDMVTTADTYVLAHQSFVITGTDASVQVTKFNHIDYLMEIMCLMFKILSDLIEINQIKSPHCQASLNRKKYN